MSKSGMSGQTVVQLHIHTSSGYPIKISPNSGPDTQYNVKVTTIQQDSHKAKNNEVQLMVLRKHDCIDVCAEGHGEVFQDNDFFIFSTSTMDLSSLIFKIDVNRCTNSTTTLVGHGYVQSSQMIESAGSLMVTLLDDSLQYKGTISVGYLVIRPYKWHHSLTSPQCEQARRLRGINEKKKDGQFYMSGHRGAGESFSGSSIYPENTISAFKAASQLGVDYVEMDVQVSKDKVPVVFHDTTVKLCLQHNTFMNSPGKKRRRGQMTPDQSEDLGVPSALILEIPVKDLSIQQMQNAKVAGIKEHEAYLKTKDKIAGSSTDSQAGTDDILDNMEMDFKLFPTLKEVFDEVPEETGLLLELKYPLAELGGESVDDECMDQNEFVDAILKVVFENSRDRKVILASFDANICSMCQYKQNQFPVYIITQDDNTIWTPYLDVRARHLDTAIAFAKAQHLDGVHSFSNELLNRPEKIDKVLEADLVLSVWGSENEKPEARQWLHEHGVLCIQVDNIFEATRKSQPS